MLISFLRLHNNYFYEVFTSCKKIRLCYKIYVHDSFYSSVLVIISYVYRNTVGLFLKFADENWEDFHIYKVLPLKAGDMCRLCFILSN